jgi:hypothetical protein
VRRSETQAQRKVAMRRAARTHPKALQAVAQAQSSSSSSARSSGATLRRRMARGAA